MTPRPIPKGASAGPNVLRRIRAWVWAVLLLTLTAGLTLTAQVARAQVPEPSDYRMDRFRAPVPATLQGATVLTTAQAKALIAREEVVLIDVLPRPPKPKGLKEGTIWRPPPRYNIAGTVWLANTGFGALSPEAEAYFKGNLERLTQGDRSRPVLIYCLADCWMSWNAAKRAVSYGYSQVYWYPEGTDGWAFEGLPLERSEPLPMPE